MRKRQKDDNQTRTKLQSSTQDLTIVNTKTEQWATTRGQDTVSHRMESSWLPRIVVATKGGLNAKEIIEKLQYRDSDTHTHRQTDQGRSTVIV